ncbi:MAG: helix-turn-helix domain-containing protein [bacterium]|nr:helix-turn-helix domain-containing protein [bacterium]
MGRREEAEELFKNGYSPEEISQKMGVSLGTVVSYLYTKVGEGKIRHSDILFSIEKDIRDEIEQIINTKGATHWFDIYKEFDKRVSPTYIKTYIELRKPTFLLKDTYALIVEIELKLHEYIRDILVDEYGEEDWWFRGVPENVRSECEDAKNNDSNPAEHPYSYTNFIHFKDILDRNWSIFSKKLLSNISSNREKFLEDLVVLNRILNKVMYPLRGNLPTEEEFEFVKRFHREIKKI